MIRLTTLGGIDLRRGDGRPIAAVLQQPRRLALLVYLAVADRAFVPRDTLLGLLWPEKPEEEARRNLHQAIHFLRRSLGTGAIRGRRSDGYGIAPSALSCDAREFLDALRQGHVAEALRLHRGEFLPGFVPTGAPDFEQWLERFRGEVRRRAAEAAWQLAEAEAEGNAVSAAALARRAVELSLGDEPAVRRLIELLARVGDHAGACEAYAALRARLADEYDAVPSQETSRLVARLRQPAPAPDLSLPGAVIQPPAGIGTVADPPTLPVAAARDGQRPRGRPFQTAASLTVTLVLIGAFVSLWGLTRDRARGAAAPSIILEDVRDYSRAPARDDLAAAVTTGVLARLASVGSIQVRAADSGQTARTHPQLLLRTGLLQTADSVRVTAVLLDGRSRVAIRRAFITRPADPSIRLVDELADRLAAFARAGAGAWARDRQWRDRDPTGRATSLMHAALRDRERADSLRRAGVTDAALARYRMADAELAKAERAAPGWSEPAIQRAELGLRQMWALLLAARPDLERSRAALVEGLRHAATAVENGDSTALDIRASLAYWLWQTAPTDSAAMAAAPALPQIERDLRYVTQRDPTRARAWITLTDILLARGEFDEALWAAERAARADAFLEYTGEIIAGLFSAALETGDRRTARESCDALRKRYSGDSVNAFCELMLLATFGTDGRADVERGWAAIRALPPEVRMSPPWQGRHDLLMSVLLARAGETDRASKLLDRAVRASGDAEAAQLVAWSLLELGRIDSAAAVLAAYAEPRPAVRIGVVQSERFRKLRDHPRIAPLLARRPHAPIAMKTTP